MLGREKLLRLRFMLIFSIMAKEEQTLQLLLRVKNGLDYMTTQIVS